MKLRGRNTKPSLCRATVLALAMLLFASTGQSAEVKSHFAKFGDSRVHYQESGKGKEALILVHGWTCNADFWRGQSSAFPSLRVIAVDLPGHGKSDKPQVDYTMEYFARSIEAVMRDAKVKSAVLVGHSMGTPIIRQFYRLYPDKTLGLVIVDGGLRLLFPKEQMEQFVGGLKSNYKTAAPQMVDGMLVPVKATALKVEIRRVMLSAPEHVAISAMDAMADERIYGKDPINVPVLAVLVKSPFWAPDTEQFLRSLAPKLEFHMWENLSHFLMMEKPVEFNQILQQFLAKNNLLKK